MIKHYQGPYYQQGCGLGGFFRGLVQFLKPVAEVLKPVISSPITQTIAKEVINTGMKFGSDLIAGKSASESAKNILTNAKKRVADTVMDSVTPEDLKEGGTGPPSFKKERKVNPIPKKVQRKKVALRTHKTIFD
jgi:hypothetical protein